MKKIIACIICVFTLTGCFWLGEGESGATGLILQDREDFSILIPSSWQEVGLSDTPIPKTWELALVYKSNNERQWYFNNIVVLKLEKSKQASSVSLMEESLQSLQTQIDNFSVISKQTLLSSDEQEWLFLTYRGKYNVSTPELTYVQTARSCSEADYYLTISLNEILDDYERYTQILQTFRCS